MQNFPSIPVFVNHIYMDILKESNPKDIFLQQKIIPTNKIERLDGLIFLFNLAEVKQLC